jgi:hypothetical protein
LVTSVFACSLVGIGRIYDQFVISPATASALNFSGTAEADGNFAGFDDDGNIAPTIGKLQHSCKALLVFQHVDVLERNFPTGISLPGARGVGSEVFSKD